MIVVAGIEAAALMHRISSWSEIRDDGRVDEWVSECEQKEESRIVRKNFGR